MKRRDSQNLRTLGLNLNFSQTAPVHSKLSSYRQEACGISVAAPEVDPKVATKVSLRQQAKIDKLEAKMQMYDAKLSQANRTAENPDFVALEKCKSEMVQLLRRKSNVRAVDTANLASTPVAEMFVQKEVIISPKNVHPTDKLPETIVIQPYSHECEGGEVFKLLQQLKHDKIAKSLYLTNVPLGEQGAALVAEMLGQNAALQTLMINGSGITDTGIVLIAFALESNKTLRKLNLCDNAITDKGLEVLGNCLGRNSTLQELKLGNNNITKLGRCWGKVNVCKMNLYGNPISNVPKKYIGERRVSNCKMFPLKKFLNETDAQISAVEKRVLSTAYTLPDKDDMWRLKAIDYHNDFRGWLENLIYDHASFKLVLLGMRCDLKCNLRFLNNGFEHLTRNIYQFLFVGNEKRYDFARARKTLRILDSLKLNENDDDSKSYES